jgi:hypothetical protein
VVNDKKSRPISVDAPGKPFFWFLMLVGMVLIAYFTFNMVVNFVYAVDLAGDGIQVVLKDAVVVDGQMDEEAEVTVLRGVSGWVEGFAPWLALNAFTLFIGVFIFGTGYVMTARDEDKLAVSLFKMRILACYLALLALLMLVLGVDRIFFIPHAERAAFLSWFDWYVIELLAHIIWAVLLAIFSVFFMRVGGLPGNDLDTVAAPL